MTKEELIAGTLKWCNEQREKKGMKPMAELPRGIRHDGWSCPCSVASGLWVGSNRYCESIQALYLRPGVTVDTNEGLDLNPEYLPHAKRPSLPGVVSEFTIAFDRGDIPELVK